MKIILLRQSGEARALRFGRRHLLLGAAAVGASLLLVVVLAARLFPAGPVDPALVDRWQQDLGAQQDELKRLRERYSATADAVGRRLAGMQARLMRMEALGTRVTQAADLDEGEFSFDQPPAVGGPSERPASQVGWPELQSSIDELAGELRTRESELEVLESMLRDREYRAGTQVEGRPITWGWMSSAFGHRMDPFSGKKAWHAGVDFAGKAGSDVVAVASGVVVFAGTRSGYGEMVEINHGDGYVTRYGHHADLHVATGDIVKKGQAIGTMGSTGRSTGPHVHFEVLKNGRHVDPTRYVARRK